MSSCPILLVEDDENDVFFFQMALKKAEVSRPVIIVGDGLQAIDYLSGKSGSQLPCLVFLDLKLPKKSGLEVLRWVREQSLMSPLIVIVLTSSEADKDMQMCYDLGANSYLVKPGNPEKLVDLLKLADQYWLQSNRLPSVPADAEKKAHSRSH